MIGHEDAGATSLDALVAAPMPIRYTSLRPKATLSLGLVSVLYLAWHAFGAQPSKPPAIMSLRVEESGSGKCRTRPWEPCDGMFFQAEHCCPAGFTCKARNFFFANCVPEDEAIDDHKEETPQQNRQSHDSRRDT